MLVSNSWGPTCILFYVWISSGILNAQSGYKTVFSGKYLLNVGWVWINFSWKILTMSPVSGHLASEYKTSAPFPHIQCQSPSLTSWWAICTTPSCLSIVVGVLIFLERTQEIPRHKGFLEVYRFGEKGCPFQCGWEEKKWLFIKFCH